jgi:hypothetical protein
MGGHVDGKRREVSLLRFTTVRIERRRRVRSRRGLADRDELRQKSAKLSMHKSEQSVAGERRIGIFDDAPAGPTRQNPAVSLRRLASHRTAGCPDRVPCTRLSQSGGRRRGARRASGGIARGRRGRPRARTTRTVSWAAHTAGRRP